MAQGLAARGVDHEERPPQVAMARAAGRALSSGRHLIVEAGTGVGKSFAYLVPLLRWADENETTVAVATSTIALQEQLIRNDLPLLAESLPFEVSYALVKGRGNYVCLRRLRRASEDPSSLFAADDAHRQLAAIRAWAATTREGSRQDLPFQPLAAVWEAVRAEQGNCKGRACPHFAACPYQRSRRRAHRVRCLVLNHHVLMADLALRRSGASFLPRVRAAVVDEAHDLEDTAAEHLGRRVSSLGVGMLLGRLWHPDRERGLLAGGGSEALRREVAEVRGVARRLFEALRAWAAAEADGTATVRLAERDFPVQDTLSPRLGALGEAVAQRAPRAPDEDLAMELAARSRGLLAASETLEGIVRPAEGEVRWMEVAARGAVALASAPVDVGPLLRDVLWDRHDCVVLTSATLATGRPPSFAFLRSRLGLRDGEDLTVGSPFDFLRQVRLVIGRGLPDPAREAQAYEAALPAAVLRAVRRSSGAALVLFTGYQSMRSTAAALRETLESDGLEVLVQGEGLERPALLERFRQSGGVLFGVATFWQGVDVRGDALRHVVIARLPFEVPTHPLQQARQERLLEQGLDPFRHLSLPLAALRLKQGFGRLIRTRSDEGTVTILDPRILTRTYGRYLVASLPECTVEVLDEEACGD